MAVIAVSASHSGEFALPSGYSNSATVVSFALPISKGLIHAIPYTLGAKYPMPALNSVKFYEDVT